MGSSELKQRLAAILAADVAGYSRLMAAGERATVASLDAARSIFKSQIESNQGRVIDMAGDSVLAVFETATGAVSAAVAVQRELNVCSTAVPEDRRMRFRIGVHMGDVIEKTDGTVYGDGVNIAARLEELAEPGGITVSGAVQGAVRGKLTASFVDLGERRLKNIAEPINVSRIRIAGVEPVPAKSSTRKRTLIIILFAAALGISAGAYYAWQPSREERTTNPNLLVAEQESATGERRVAASATSSAVKAAADRLAAEKAALDAERTRIAAAKTAAEKEKQEAERLAAEAKAAQERAQVAAAAPASGGAASSFQVAATLEGEGRGREAVRAYAQAARSGNCEAAKRLGDIYDKGLIGISRDYVESTKWYNAARALGCEVPLQQRRG